MTAYGLAHLYNPQPHHTEVLEYLERIQNTLDPYGGRFLVHGGSLEVLEGSWPGALVVIEPGHDSAKMAARLRRHSAGAP